MTARPTLPAELRAWANAMPADPVAFPVIAERHALLRAAADELERLQAVVYRQKSKRLYLHELVSDSAAALRIAWREDEQQWRLTPEMLELSPDLQPLRALRKEISP